MLLKAGDRVRLTQPIDRYPDDLIPAGETGTITGVSKSIVRLKLDEQHNLEDWDNCLEFYPRNNPGHCYELLYCLEKL